MGHSPPRIVSLAEDPAAANAAYAFQCMGIEPIAAPLPTPLKPVDCIAYVEQLSPVCDVLVLPLGLCAGMSLDIAREVHRQESGIRTVLFTGSLTATADTATPLFDYIRCSRSSGLHIVLKQAWCEPVPPRQGREAVERQIATLIDTEHCFRQLRPVPLSLMRVDALLARDKRYFERQAYLALAWGAKPSAAVLLSNAHPPRAADSSVTKI